MTPDRLFVVLVATRNPLNLGAAARAAGNFGVRRLRVVKPYSPAFREARSAVGASAILQQAEEFSTLAEAVADCSLVVGTTALARRSLEHALHPLPQGAARIRRGLRAGSVALVFGSEKRGLSNDDLSHCHWLMRIPTRAEQGSMNLGQAVAVCLYELARSAPKARAAARDPLAPSAVAERMASLLLESLDESGYIKPGAGPVTGHKLRRLVRRLSIPAADGEVWLGMLRQVLWKLRHPGGTR